jgi:hypothetical protein
MLHQFASLGHSSNSVHRPHDMMRQAQQTSMLFAVAKSRDKSLVHNRTQQELHHGTWESDQKCPALQQAHHLCHKLLYSMLDISCSILTEDNYSDIPCDFAILPAGSYMIFHK